jgi:DNA-binding ferritin-like protein (Dps family)
MEKLRYDNLIARLVDAVPEFPADPEYVKDNLVYLVFNDLARFVISLFEAEAKEDLLRRIFDFMEEAASSQDQRITDVLWDSFNELAMKEPDKAKSYMGRYTRKIYQDVEEEIYGSPSVVRKIGRTIKSLWERP